jgi:hypothetical protein
MGAERKLPIKMKNKKKIILKIKRKGQANFRYIIHAFRTVCLTSCGTEDMFVCGTPPGGARWD